MTEVFADTFNWLAVLNPEDASHHLAVNTSLPGRMVTTWAVLIEVMDALCEQRVRPLATGFWEATQQDPDLLILPLDTKLLERGAGLFAERNDKNWSLTDCLSFVVMEERAIDIALTGDHHFEQAGYRALLREQAN